MLRDRGAFEPFPSAHLRTNGFIVAAETARRLGLAQVRSKDDAYRLESGPGSITNQVVSTPTLMPDTVNSRTELERPNMLQWSHSPG